MHAALPLRHFLLALAIVTVWGTNFVVIKIALGDVPPLLFATLRFILVFLPAAVVFPRPSVSLGNLALYGILIGVGQFGLLYIAMNGLISPGIASLVIQSQVFFTIGLAALLAGFQQSAKKQHLMELKFAEYQQRIARQGPVHGISEWQKVKPIHELFRRYGQDYRFDHLMLLAQGYQESRLDQQQRSARGAIGVMQLMPDTAASLGVNPYDEKQNVEGGAKYLREMLDAFGGDVKKAVAAYNAGSQAVKDYNGVPPYRETQDYVNKVLDLYQ